MNRKMMGLGALALGLAAIPAVSVAASPASTIAARTANFKAIGKAFKGVLDQFKTPAPDVAVIQASAATLVTASAKVAGHFPKGTGPASGVKTHALPAIWEKPADFSAAAAKFVAASKAFQVAAASGNMDQIKGAIPALGGSCKGCHDQFKAKD